MKINKKSAARMAAAKHSTNPVAATIEYAGLIGQTNESLSTEKVNKIQREMLAFLPHYRHPTNVDLSADTKIYFQLFGQQGQPTAAGVGFRTCWVSFAA